MASNNQKFNNKQAGVTLLLAILVLSSLMAISFSLATILFVEIRSSGDLLRTEPAYYGVVGVGEEALFNIKRSACSSNCNYTSQFSNNVSASMPVQTSTSTPIFQDKIPANTTFTTAKTYLFYDPSNPTGGSNYGKITLTYLNTGNSSPPNLYGYLCQYDPSGQTQYTNPPVCSNISNSVTQGKSSYWLANDFILNSPSGIVSQSWDYSSGFDPNQQQELILFNTDPQDTIYVSIETFGPGKVTGSPGDSYSNGSYYTPKGLPYAGQTAVDISTTNSSVGRKVKIIIPNTPAPIGSLGTPNFVQAATASSGVSAPFSLSFSQNTTPGNEIISGIAWSYSGCPPSVTDTQGNTFTQAAVSLKNGYYMYWFTAPIGPGGPDTMNVTATCGYERLAFMGEYSGMSSPEFDSGSSQTDSSSPCSSGSITTSQNVELILGAFADSSSRGFSAGPGFTQRAVNDAGDIVEDQVQSSSGPITATASCSANGTYGAYGFVGAFIP